MWIYVIPHFQKFLHEIELSAEERADADSKADRIARGLWSYYYSGEFNPRCYLKVGSYGKRTAIRPPSDLDMLFLLPRDAYNRTERLFGNKQSQLLQEVKRTLERTFPRTDLRADGQVIAAPFQTYNVDVIPAFVYDDTTYWTAHTADGGSWRASNPAAEYELIRQADLISDGKATHLCKMLKAWKSECSVEIKSISLEVLACLFVKQWPFRNKSLYYYDWMVRDFFQFMLGYRYQGWTRVIGTEEILQLGDEWVSKCETAHRHSLEACDNEVGDYRYLAEASWRRIFGNQFERVPLMGLAATAGRT
ncbi:MAG TPA: hypothetical protein VN861_18420 [Candidatus Acidoferrales bacterium]|nr:hypothetical protein [Candidatus Acidoferrales bacterium]